MRLSILLATVCAAASGAAAPPAPSAEPRVAPPPIAVGADSATAIVTVTGLRGTGGSLRVGLYEAAGWPGQLPRAYISAPVTSAGSQTVRLIGLPPRDYAVVAYHDANDNDRLDRIGGRVVEGYGVSRAKTRAMPSFDAARQTFKTGNNPVRIAMRYP